MDPYTIHLVRTKPNETVKFFKYGAPDGEHILSNIDTWAKQQPGCIMHRAISSGPTNPNTTTEVFEFDTTENAQAFERVTTTNSDWQIRAEYDKQNAITNHWEVAAT